MGLICVDLCLSVFHINTDNPTPSLTLTDRIPMPQRDDPLLIQRVNLLSLSTRDIVYELRCDMYLET